MRSLNQVSGTFYQAFKHFNFEYRAYLDTWGGCTTVLLQLTVERIFLKLLILNSAGRILGMSLSGRNFANLLHTKVLSENSGVFSMSSASTFTKVQNFCGNFETSLTSWQAPSIVKDASQCIKRLELHTVRESGK